MPQLPEPIAVIGMACRYGGSITNTSELLKHVMEAKSVYGPMPKTRMDGDFLYHPQQGYPGSIYTKGGYFVDGDINEFDAPFFQLSENDAVAMDPQQRMLLENVYHALENAGLSLKSVASTATSVYVGCSNNDALALSNADHMTTLQGIATGASPSILANRVSWFFDLHGPSLSIDTACSSSLVAFHQACRDIQNEDSPMARPHQPRLQSTTDRDADFDVGTRRPAALQAIVSGVNIIEYPGVTQIMCSLGVLSPDGQCFSFDERANGYGRGEGVGTVIIKSLRAARRDGDRVRAVVRATGSSQDGRTPGITLPSSIAQEALIRQVYESADIGMADTGYVEAHGTGTSVGDPLELAAIVSAFGTNRDAELYVGSVKSVIGHLEGGAGIAGLISAVLAVEAGLIPPVTNLQVLNPQIQVNEHIVFAKEARLWPPGEVRRASVNSFGFGGSNAHVVLEDLEGFLRKNIESIKFTAAGDHEMSRAGLNGVESYINGLPNEEMKTDPVNTCPDEMTRDTETKHPGSSNTNRGIAKPGVNDSERHRKSEDSGLRHGANPIEQLSSKKRILALSAFDEEGCRRNNGRLVEYLEKILSKGEETDRAQFLADFLYTMNEKRSSFDWRAYCVLDSLESLLASLRQPTHPMRISNTPKILRFIFTGQGANWPGMAQDLMVYSLFRKRIHEASDFFSGLGSTWNLEASLPREDMDVGEPSWAQSSCVAVQVALVDLLMSWNLVPTTVVGHSSGEIAAAYCAGKISRQAAWKIAFYRGTVCANKADGSGGMLAAAIAENEAEELLSRLGKDKSLGVQIGCFNSPKNLTFTAGCLASRSHTTQKI
ncbi:hypothetical protein CDD83_3266 [Cordyceps sp. RAO-2017]|nr:hypothetical protein CDD83_3266 [Cordyceps sp. RAO-2017]